jgi:hypothetical protein
MKPHRKIDGKILRKVTMNVLTLFVILLLVQSAVGRGRRKVKVFGKPNHFPFSNDKNNAPQRVAAAKREPKCKN